ncbi:MAG: ATP phosphoribosyltransferase [Clostridia bacterium]|nr:ATP phosphoribosyltransferase [Clostridia bacterium]
MFSSDILKFDEKLVFAMRDLYVNAGYKKYKMSKFEEYDLYSKNKDFLVSEGVITFNDTDGRLLALKPDVTLSIIKNSRDTNGVEKYYYNENVYRISESSRAYKEIMQTGLECIGKISASEIFEVTVLALQSLSLVAESFKLNLSDVALVDALLQDYGVPSEKIGKVKNAIADKNSDMLLENLLENQYEALSVLLNNYDSVQDSLNAVKNIVKSQNSLNIYSDFKALCDKLIASGYERVINIDFSITPSNGYYSGVVFKGYVSGIAQRVLSGGRYDKLIERMGRKSGAIGFAVYLDTLEWLENKASASEEDEYINIALPKGRLGEKVYDMFERAGYECPAIKEPNRKLIFENAEKKVRYFWVKPSDVTIYVERGAADIGVAGKDILLEYAPDVYELLDLNVGKCRMAVASKSDFKDDTSKTLRVATKFSNIAKNYYANKCRDIDIIHLNGSIEIAPILGLSDVIVDIVETGKTLLENDLMPFETIVPISARLIANKASFGFKQRKIVRLQEELSKQVKKDD